MGGGWQADKRWSDQFIPTIKSILAETFIKEAHPKADQEQNTDLMAFEVSPFTVACRIRGMEYNRKYPFDITIRLARPTGAKTELDKLIEGWGDYFFYGFGDEATSAIPRWIIVDLKHLRAQMIRQKRYPLERRERTNGDGTRFVALDTRKLQRPCIHCTSPGYFPRAIFPLPLDVS